MCIRDRFAGQALTKTHPVVFWNENQAVKSIERVLHEADVIYPGHDQPFRIVNGGVEYMAPMELTITGVSQDEPGLVFGEAPQSIYIMPGIEEQTIESLGRPKLN